ncbi:hypothetical protein DLJ59_07495 [Micromonospora inaquosa]|uniref:Uncharacterized protein n=1 Tax=Micromonospora inaquosa TaxID=2203716 RepID=A0A3N9XFW0_9ACTN|nr:hypothetical protein DLJ59_07495 [Micromonospora inaquosa]
MLRDQAHTSGCWAATAMSNAAQTYSRAMRKARRARWRAALPCVRRTSRQNDATSGMSPTSSTSRLSGAVSRMDSMTTPSAAATAVDLADDAAYLEAVAQARKAADAYYGSGESDLDDETYDRLLRGINAWEDGHPGQVAVDSPSQQVAAGVTTYHHLRHAAQPGRHHSPGPDARRPRHRLPSRRSHPPR